MVSAFAGTTIYRGPVPFFVQSLSLAALDPASDVSAVDLVSGAEELKHGPEQFAASSRHAITSHLLLCGERLSLLFRSIDVRCGFGTEQNF